MTHFSQTKQKLDNKTEHLQKANQKSTDIWVTVHPACQVIQIL